MDGSQSIYFGMPGYGKTFLATKHAQASGLPVLAVDSVARMAWPPAIVSDPVEAFLQVVGRRRSVRWRPRSRKELDVLCKSVLEHGGIEFLLDECSQWMMPNWAPIHLDTLIRTARPLGVNIRLTTQDPTGFTRRLRTCMVNVYGFRLEDDDALRWVRLWFGARLDAMKSLRKRKFLEWHA